MKNLYIPSIDAKDLYLANNFRNPVPDGYSLLREDGSVYMKKFVNSFDYCLDMMELQNAAKKIYKTKKSPSMKESSFIKESPSMKESSFIKDSLSLKDSFSFIYKNKEYCSKIINVTFQYAVKEFNRMIKDIYVRNGYHFKDFDCKDGFAVVTENGKQQLAVIDLGKKYAQPIPSELLPPYFSCEYEKETMMYTYKLAKPIKTVKTAKELREWCYTYGFTCNGIHYCRLKRSSGSARVGKCLFIDARLYSAIHAAEQCGLNVQTGDALDLAAYEAYIALSTSSLIDTIAIKPENILVINDWNSTFYDDAVCTGLGEDGWLQTEEKKMKISNSIWDGQSLIDISLMGPYAAKGMLLLRNKFFKSCCFNTNIQAFFQDNNITALSQIQGETIAKDIKDIKLITTPSSIKFYKFGNLKTWLKNIYPFFGIVKYDKNTHFFDGNMVQAHYQLLNTLQLSKDEVQKIVQDGLDYVSLLNTDADVMRFHLKFTKTHENSLEQSAIQSKADIVFQLLGYDCDFQNTKLYYDFKKDICRSYLTNMRKGHILLNGTYATLFGNPYEMLLHSIGRFDGSSIIAKGTVYTTKYAEQTQILGSRSPHVTIGNILLTKNIHCKEIKQYFNLTPNIICINSINENILERLSGSDFDSDSMLITDNAILVNAAKKNYHLFKVPTRNINPPKSKRHYTPKDLADLDDKSSNNKIGEIVNLSQELNSLLWDMIQASGQTAEEQYPFIKEIYYDVCQLDVMSNIEIDKAKKEYPIHTANELKKIRKKYEHLLTMADGRKKTPYFLGFIADTKNYKNEDKKDYQKYNTSMDYLHTCLSGKRAVKSKGRAFLPLSDIFKPNDYNRNSVDKRQVSQVIQHAETADKYRKAVAFSTLPLEDKNFLMQQAKDDLLYNINRLKLNKHTMYRLLWHLEKEKNSSIKSLLFYTLFQYKNNTLLETLKQYGKVNTFLSEDHAGDLYIYGRKYAKKIVRNPLPENA